MKTKTYALDNRNARTRDAHAKEVLRKSLETFGAGRSITVDAENVVISGNGVYEQAIALGIPVREIETDGTELIVVKRTDLETRAPRRIGLALADNQTATLAAWDEPVLEELKAELLGEIEFEAMGFEEPTEPEPEGTAEALVDQAAALLEKWGVERGQVWEIPGKAGVHRVMCGDSTDAGDVALLLAGAKPYLMVTDPPYGVEYDPSWRQEAAAKGHISYAPARFGDVTNDDRMDWADAWKLLPCSVAYVWHAGRYAVPAIESLEATGFEIRSQIIWRKTHFVISRGNYHWQHEPCWYAVRKGANAQWIGDRSQSTVWDIALVDDDRGDKGHGTQKPIECMARPIGNHEGDVCDPFLGSGTTVIASELHKRSCWGMEIEPKYVAVTLERCAKAGMEPVKVHG